MPNWIGIGPRIGSAKDANRIGITARIGGSCKQAIALTENLRVMRVDAEFAGIIVAVGFLVVGAVGLEIGKWFVLGALLLGAVFALLLRSTRKE